MILEKPVISEKAIAGAEQNVYAFKVAKKANKIQVKEAVEKSFGVKVKSVNIINIKSKKVSFRRIAGTRASWKKAIVTLQKGEKLEALK